MAPISRKGFFILNIYNKIIESDPNWEQLEVLLGILEDLIKQWEKEQCLTKECLDLCFDIIKKFRKAIFNRNPSFSIKMTDIYSFEKFMADN